MTPAPLLGKSESAPLTAEQRKIMEFLLPAMGEGLTLAHDIACDIGCPPRAMGAKLRALERRGMVKRQMAVRAKTPRQNHLYGWELTGAGWESVL